MSRLPSRPVFPGTTQFQAPETPEPLPPEPPWMLSGWIELTCRSRPGWRAICETSFDVACEIQRGPRFLLYRALRRGPAVGDHFPILGVYYVALGPFSGQLVVMPAETGENQ
jgi:hypothetical protein